MCIPDSRYGLTLEWVTSENSTMLLESDILRLFFTGPYLVSSPLCSGVWCWLPLRGSTPTSLFASLLSSLNCLLLLASLLSSHQLSFSPVQLPTASLGLLPPTLSLGLLPPTVSPGLQPPTLILGSNYQLPFLLSSHQQPLYCPTTNCLSLGRVVNSHSPPRTTSGYGEISCPKILCLVSRQNRQLNRLLWQPTPIVLHYVYFPLREVLTPFFY